MDFVRAKGDIIGGGECCHAENWLIIANYQSHFTYLSSRNHQNFVLLSPVWHRSRPLMMSPLLSPNPCPCKPPLSCNVLFQFYCWRRTLLPKHPDTICSVATFIHSIDTYFMISLTCIVCAECSVMLLVLTQYLAPPSPSTFTGAGWIVWRPALLLCFTWREVNDYNIAHTHCGMFVWYWCIY